MGTPAGQITVWAPEGRRQATLGPDAAPPGLKMHFAGCTDPRLARRGLNDRARFAGLQSLLPSPLGGEGLRVRGSVQHSVVKY